MRPIKKNMRVEKEIFRNVCVVGLKPGAEMFTGLICPCIRFTDILLEHVSVMGIG